MNPDAPEDIRFKLSQQQEDLYAKSTFDDTVQEMARERKERKRMRPAFNLHKWDIVELRNHLEGAEYAGFDVNADGDIEVHVEGKGTLDL